jgi:hypothetical protein
LLVVDETALEEALLVDETTLDEALLVVDETTADDVALDVGLTLVLLLEGLMLELELETGGGRQPAGYATENVPERVDLIQVL